MLLLISSEESYSKLPRSLSSRGRHCRHLLPRSPVGAATPWRSAPRILTTLQQSAGSRSTTNWRALHSSSAYVTLKEWDGKMPLRRTIAMTPCGIWLCDWQITDLLTGWLADWLSGWLNDVDVTDTASSCHASYHSSHWHHIYAPQKKTYRAKMIGYACKFLCFTSSR